MDAHRAEGVQVGDDNIQHNHFYRPRVPLTWPHQVGVVPTRADCFQPRRAGVDLLGPASAQRAAALTWVLSGLGGAGKTQLAVQFVHKAWDAGSVDLLVWISASSREAIVAGYAQASGEVGTGGGEDDERAAAKFLTWLQHTDRRWLVVLDDLADPGDVRGLWPPQTPIGQVVVTTRRRDAVLTWSGRRLIDVDLFTPAEAIAYLTRKLGGRAGQLLEVGELAEDLGYLPLALAQAAAYMLDRDLDCASYRRRFADRRHRLTDLVPEDGALPDDHRATVAVTWSLSIDLADQLRPVGLARPLLELASVMDPNGIPEMVLAADAALAYLSAYRRQAGADGVGVDDVRDTLHCLHRLSLVSRDPANAARRMRVHALVQRATREQMSADRLTQAIRLAADALAGAWPEVERDLGLSQALRANTATLAAMNHSALWTEDDGGHRVLFLAGQSLGESGNATAAEDYFQQMHTTAIARLGPDHPTILPIRYEIAYWRGVAGDPAGAAAALDRLLDDYLRVLGPDHRYTMRVRSKLAYMRGEAGDPAGAVTAFQHLLADRTRVLGPDHSDTLAARHLVARWRGVAGDPEGAAAATEALLADYLRILGPDHRDTFHIRHSLARWRGYSGHVDVAVAAFEQLLDDRSRVLGPDHPDTLTTCYQLARWRGEAGDRATAIAGFEQLLADRIRILGPDHPDTHNTRNNLAYWLGEIHQLPEETTKRSDH